ncbi:hypothetical protein [Methanopyrus sp. SNP6]|uniref:hypothetical protein n=1 Tax=Methanopyrus sp. SNP6 TaxID=1937005 RepID=UPI0011E5F0DD|nr:hypothetical protein [Methanopyrus sp. SNP6]
MNELLGLLLIVLSTIIVAGFVDDGPMCLTSGHTGVVVQWNVTRAFLTTPELDEGAVFVRKGDSWRETMGETDVQSGLSRWFTGVRIRWNDGYLHVQCPKFAEVLLLVPSEDGVPVTEDSTFLEGGPLSEGAHALLGERVRIHRYSGPFVLGISFETARKSIVSVRWTEGGTYYEYTYWAAHDWDREVHRYR